MDEDPVPVKRTPTIFTPLETLYMIQRVLDSKRSLSYRGNDDIIVALLAARLRYNPQHLLNETKSAIKATTIAGYNPEVIQWLMRQAEEIQDVDDEDRPSIMRAWVDKEIADLERAKAEEARKNLSTDPSL